MRRSASDRRGELLGKVAGYLLDHGLAELSLRPLAAAAGTSARMLLYHFGSKEQLLAEAMDEIRRRQQKLLESWMRRHRDASRADLLRFVWSWVAAPKQTPYLRLFLEVLGQGFRGREPFEKFPRSTFQDWVSWMESRGKAAGWSPSRARDFAILTVATIRGLALYWAGTGDARGATLALQLFIRLTESR